MQSVVNSMQSVVNSMQCVVTSMQIVVTSIQILYDCKCKCSYGDDIISPQKSGSITETLKNLPRNPQVQYIYLDSYQYANCSY
jgi:3-deoxy-D-manno-octulosonic acid (KDO) 8-phosphate synthase